MKTGLCFIIWAFVVSMSLTSALPLIAKTTLRAELLLATPHISPVQSLRGGASTFHDLSISALATVESIVWLKAWTTLAKEKILDSKITRKIIHAGSAPLFIAHWPLYSRSPGAKYLAAVVPLLQVIRSATQNEKLRFFSIADFLSIFQVISCRDESGSGCSAK